jgi:hypothetical protein
MSQIYISYRVEDAPIVKRIVRRCLQTHGIYSVVMNPQNSYSENNSLNNHIDNLMFNVETILLVAGRNWAGIDEFGRFRLSSADIPVSAEVKVALRSGKQVILVLVDDAPMPSPDVVPEDLEGIFQLPVAQLRSKTFNQDLDRLIPPPSLQGFLLYYLSLRWTKNYIREDEFYT